MNGLETNIGQISFSSRKLSKSYVSVFSEKLSTNGAELYAIVEFPNKTESSGTWADYDKASKIICAALRNNFRYAGADSFENFLAQANAELATMAAEGNGPWLGKIQAVVAAKVGPDLYAATVGRIHAYLFRHKQFSNIADSAAKINLAKIFENFVVGRLAKQDIVILSTAELTNLVSLERLQQELSSPSIEESTRLIADLMQESGDKDLSVGTIFLAIGREQLSPEQALTSIERSSGLSRGKQVFNSIESGAAGAAKAAAGAAVAFGSQLGSRIREVDLRPAAIKARGLELGQKTAGFVDPKKFRELPRTKKFFIAMAALFIMLAAVDIVVGIHIRNVRATAAKQQQAFTAIRNDISEANSAQTYSDSAQSQALLADAESRFKALPPEALTTPDGKNISQQLQALYDAINKISRLSSSQIADFGSAVDRILFMNGTLYGMHFSSDTIASYDLSSHATSTATALPVAHTFAAATTQSGQLLLKDNSGALWLYDPTKGTVAQQKATLPAGSIGLSTYATDPIKAYAIDATSQGAIVSTYLNATTINRTSADFSQALDIATGSTGAYVLLANNILKYASGQPRAFQTPTMQFPQGSKLYLTASHLYVLNPATKTVICFDPSGNLVAQYESDTLTNPIDFAVDEANKVIYVLNGTAVLALPLAS